MNTKVKNYNVIPDHSAVSSRRSNRLIRNLFKWIPAGVYPVLRYGAGMTIILFFLPSPAFASELANQFTVSLWVNPTTSVTSKALAVKNTEIQLYTDASGYANCQIYTSSWQTGAVGTTALPLNTWSHVSCTYDKANIKIYVGGILQNSVAQTAAVNDAATNWRVGSDESGTYGDLTGTTDEFKIYNYARTQKQIVEDMLGGGSVIASGARQSASGAVGYWKFDEGYGTVANNSGSGGSSLNGTLTPGAGGTNTTAAAMWDNAGKYGKAMEFDGTDDYVQIPDSSALDITNITISAWIKATTLGGRIIDKITVGETDGYLMDTYNSKIRICANTCPSSNTTLSTGTWLHITLTFDGTTTKFYLNGSPDGSSTSIISISTNALNLRFGADQNGTSLFSGLIDDVRVYNYALTPLQIKLLYNENASVRFGPNTGSP